MKTRIPLIALCLAVSACSSARPVDGAQVGPRLLAARDLGPPSRDTEFQVVIGLRLRQPERLNKLLNAREVDGDVLAPDDFAELFAPSAGQYARMVTWLSSRGLLVERTAIGRTTITVRGTATAFESAFATPVHRFVDNEGEFAAFVAPPRYDTEFVNLASGQVGLGGERGWFSHLMVPEPGPQLNATTSLNAWDLEQLYKTATVTGTFPSGTNAPTVANPGMGETIAILGTGGPPQRAGDIEGATGYMSRYKPYGLSALPPTGGGYSIVNVGGPSRQDAQADANDYGENVLDIDMILAMAPYAKIVHVMTATNAPALFTDGISYIVNQVPTAHSVSVSYGTCERGSAGQMPVVSALLAQAKAQGQVWFFATGDSGTDGCREVDPFGNPTGPGGNKIISAGWPASDPNVIGVGGTKLVAGVGGGVAEQAWENGGGAPSETFDKPAYQTAGTPADGARDQPDVAAMAGLPYMNVVKSGQSVSYYGTSAATPMWAGVWALLDQAKGGAGLKMAHEKLYQLGGGTSFNDITVGQTTGPDGIKGTQPGEKAKVGYDLATGWGTPVLPKLIQNWN